MSSFLFANSHPSRVLEPALSFVTVIAMPPQTKQPTDSLRLYIGCGNTRVCFGPEIPLQAMSYYPQDGLWELPIPPPRK